MRILAIDDHADDLVSIEALLEQLDELRRWHDPTLGREGRILELKREVNELLVAAGRAPRYGSVLEAAERQRTDA